MRLSAVHGASSMKFLLLILKNVRRNLLRSSLTALGTMVLVLVVTLVWSMLAFLDLVTSEKKQNLKAIVTERWQIPSQMPLQLCRHRWPKGRPASRATSSRLDSMTWQFFGGALDKENVTRENAAVRLRHGAEEAADDDGRSRFAAGGPGRAISTRSSRRWRPTARGSSMGKDWMRILNKRVGDRITLYGLNYRGIDLEFEIVGVFPPGRYDKSAVMNRDYLNGEVDDWPRSTTASSIRGRKRLNLVWLRVPDTDGLFAGRRPDRDLAVLFESGA